MSTYNDNGDVFVVVTKVAIFPLESIPTKFMDLFADVFTAPRGPRAEEVSFAAGAEIYC